MVKSLARPNLSTAEINQHFAQSALIIILHLMYLSIVKTMQNTIFFPLFDKSNDIGEIHCFLRRVILQYGNSLLARAESRATFVLLNGI